MSTPCHERGANRTIRTTPTGLLLPAAARAAEPEHGAPAGPRRQNAVSGYPAGGPAPHRACERGAESSSVAQTPGAAAARGSALGVVGARRVCERVAAPAGAERTAAGCCPMVAARPPPPR